VGAYDISASTEVERQKHHILALGYMLDLLRRFAGPRWTSPQVEVIGPKMDLSGRSLQRHLSTHNTISEAVPACHDASGTR
jgi:hypothetical protein